MKRDDMGRDVLSPSRPARNPRLEKIFTTRRSFPESRFSQAGKAPEDAPGWIRGSPGTRPRPQRALWAPIRTDIAAPAAAESPQRHPEASRSDPERFGAIRSDLPGGDPTAKGDGIDWATPEDVACSA